MDKSVSDFSDSVAKIIFDDTQYSKELLFYLTRHCNLACSGCYMCSNPNVSRAMIPMQDVRHWLKEFENVPNFDDSVVFSGGEIFTLPTVYIEHNAHQVLDRGWRLQLKTNGSWVADTERRDAVRVMLHRLQPHQVMVGDDTDIARVMGRLPRAVWRAMGNKLAAWLLWRMMEKRSALDMVVSVDDKLHPKRSARWFEDIAHMLATDKRLARTVNLQTFTFYDSVSYFEDKVLGNPRLNVSDLVLNQGKSVCTFNAGAKHIESFFGDFVEPGTVPIKQKLNNIVVPDGLGGGRVIYSVMPDRTIGVECDFVDSVGRVSYVDGNGKLKSFNQIQSDIHQKLVDEYRRLVTK